LTVQCIYEVIVRNELTGDTAAVALSAACGQEAQVEALHYLFHSRGWNKAVALPPTVASAEPANAADRESEGKDAGGRGTRHVAWLRSGDRTVWSGGTASP
jgi:hypothetical protein